MDAARIRGLRRDYSLANGVTATADDTRALVDTAITEEILFREGIARGFEQGDRSIAWRLVLKMRYLGEDAGEDFDVLYRKALELGLHLSDPVVRRIMVEKMRLLVGRSVPKPTDEELAAWYAEHGREYQQAERVTLRHVFFDRGRRSAEGAEQAAAAAAILASDHGAGFAADLGGDPFVMGNQLAAQGRGDLTKFFGPTFADEALSMPEGVWSAPIESAYGWHLVFIEKRFAPRVPELAEVRSRVEKSWENLRREARLGEFLEEARAAYTIRVDESALLGGATNRKGDGARNSDGEKVGDGGKQGNDAKDTDHG